MDKKESHRSCAHADHEVVPIGLTSLLHEQLDHFDRCGKTHEPEPEATKARLRKRSCRKQGEHGESGDVQKLVVRITGNAQRRKYGKDQDCERGGAQGKGKETVNDRRFLSVELANGA